MIQHAAKLRSPNGRKFITGLGLRNSQKTNPTRPTTKSVANVCTRQNGSPNQSHSCPLLSITSQETMTTISSDNPIESKMKWPLLQL